MKKSFFIFAFLLFVQPVIFAQVRFSIATDVSVLHNFSPHQKFWSFGQGVEGDFHFSKKNTLYAWINYHTKGSFTNTFVANAKASSTAPAAINYEVKGKWGLRQVSVGWKRYFKGSFNEENNLTIYGTAGFGLLFSKVQNALLTVVDTSLYTIQPTPVFGNDEFKRLTIDLAIGTEYPLASGIFLYGDVRTSLPASDYPSPFFHDQKRIPLPVMLNIGIRVLFGYDE